MTSKERINKILNRKEPDRVGFWLGNPAAETKALYKNQLKINCDNQKFQGADLVDIELHSAFKSDLLWVSPTWDLNLYKHPEGKKMLDVYGGKKQVSHSQPGVFADCEDIRDVELFDWPDPQYLDFSSSIETIEKGNAKELAIFSGLWMPFFHILADFFGMENYFMQMYLNPKIVEAVTDRLLNFYLEGNKRFLDLAADKIDAQFFGNDLGSQFAPLIGMDLFKQFVYPGIKRIVDQAKSYDLKVVLHSCGSVLDLIPYFIDAGVDALHPIQAKAKDMDAENLTKHFKNDLVFIGGVDTQDLLPFGTPQQIRDEVKRLKDVFGSKFIVSPSHEALLPNVSLENALAMRDAAVCM